MKRKMVLMSIILVAFVAKGIHATERTGTIVGKIRDDLLKMHIVLVDTTKDNIPDYGIVYLYEYEEFLHSLLERGATVSFSDDGVKPFQGRPSVTERNLISVGGVNMLDWLPGNEKFFPYAAEAQRRTQAPAQPQSAEERRIAELEAELQRLKQGR